jgi:hypothetical protein
MKTEQKIKSIEKGWGEGSSIYSTDPTNKHYLIFHVDVIKKEQREHLIGNADNECVDIIVYRGYTADKMIFEIESGSGVTLTFWEESK